MGRIKSKVVKRTSNILMSEDSRFSPDFEENKSIIKGLMPSKKVRNQIAGQLARLKKRKTKSNFA
jgi:ribosomal protein S17E